MSVICRPTNEKKKKLKKKLSEYLKRGKAIARPLAVTIKRVNEIVRGWINYFRIGMMKQFLEEFGEWLRHKIRVIAIKQWKRPKTIYRMKIIKSQMTMGELIAFIEYTTLFINPCIRILKSNASIQKLKVSINRIYDFLEMKNSIAQNNYGIKIRNRINEIVFDNVSFSYDKKMVIENLSFKLERGKTYAFVGETGCGKSTIVNLLFRLWDTKSGNIMIDGENIKEYNLFSLRKQLSIATQNVYIKDDSIENNILMGRKKEDCAYDEICKLVGMESILSKFPKEKDVSVGENGNKLSGGQKQRIAMARALVHADNVLILDEATSALDNITQNEIMKNIKPLYQDKIVIIITHRLDTISDVDKIFVMSEGRICEEGQHNELMKKGEKYYALVQNL